MNTMGISRTVRVLFVILALFAADVHRLGADTIAAGKDFAGAIIGGTTLYTWGHNASGQLGHSAGTSIVALPKSISGSWKAVAMGDDFTLAIDQNDKLWAWGGNGSGQLGVGNTTSSSVPVLVALPADAVVRKVVAGQAHVVALVDRGASTGLVYVWGANGSGQLGQSNTAARSTPVQLKLAAGITPSFKVIAATSASSLVIATDGSLWACGFNARGELGQGGAITAKNIFLPKLTRVGSSRAWTAVAGGTHHVLALQGTKLFAWGDNSQGQLGTGVKPAYVTAPAQITTTVLVGKKRVTLLWAGISAGAFHSYAITSTGDGYAWGFNQIGALALPVNTIGRNIYTTPQLVFSAGATTMVSFACGYDFTVALNSAGDILAVGGNAFGQLGNGRIDVLVNPIPSFAASLVGGVTLAAGEPLLASATLGSNTSFSTTFSVSNTGGRALTGSYVAKVYLSKDATLDSTDRLLAQRTVAGPLAAGASQSVTFGPSELTLPDIAAGSYYLISQVVTTDVADPLSPANGAAVAVQLVGPDLALEQVSLANTTVDALTTSFNSVTLTLANRNYGLVPAGKMIRVEAYLSTDATLNPGGDLLLSTFTQTVAAPGFAASDTLSLNLGNLAVPAGLTGGPYQLIFVVNSDNAIAETGSAANILTTPVTIASADLAVSAPVLPTITLAQGATTKTLGANTTIGTISTYVQNQGAQAYSASYTIELYLSSNATFEPSDLLIATRTIPAGSLASLGSTLLDWSNVVIPNYPPGAAFLIARVKLPDDQPDRNQLNNTAATPVIIAGPALTFSDFVFPNTTSVAAGASLGSVSYKLTNSAVGAVAAGQTVTVELFLSTDGVLDRSADVLLDQYTYTGGLVAGGNVILPSGGRTITLPANIRNGIYQLLFVSTVNGTSTVTAVTNSPVAQTIAVGALDVSVTAPSLSPTDLGTNARLPQTAVSVKNSGGFAVPAGLGVNLYLSVDGTVDQNDTLLGTQTLAVPLAAGETRTVTFTGITVPDIGQGSYKLVAQLVLPAALIDLDPTNNTAATAVTLTRPTLAFKNLTVGSTLDLDLPAPTFTGVSFSLLNDSRGDIPAGTTLTYKVYLSRDAVLSANDVLLKTGTVTGGIPGTITSVVNEVAVAPFDLPIDPNTVGGNYYLLFVVNQDGAAVLASAQTIQTQQLVILQKTNAPGVALDYGKVVFGGTAQWHSVTDTRASGGQAFEASGLTPGQTATLSYTVDGPTTVIAPWKILAEATDTLSYSIDGGAPVRTISGYDPVFKLPEPGMLPITVPAGAHTITWTYTQGSANTLSLARLDLDIPAYIASGDDSWRGVQDVTAPVNGDYARSPTLAAGQQASLEVSVNGPALVSFWWMASSTADQDTLSFFIDGVLASLPTKTAFEVASPAVLSGSQPWSKVAFLIPGGPHTLRWTYAQGSANAASYVGVDGLQVLSPVPATSAVNRDTTPATHANVPPNNTDIAITAVTAPQGTYLLDDANGTSRLPVTVQVSSVGADYASAPVWDASRLEIRLSTNRIAGDADDIILGSYARMNVIQNGSQVVFDTEVNLPLSIPTGNYYLIVRVLGSSSTPESEFTLANNTLVLGPGYHIQRAPNLVLGSSTDDTTLSTTYPYHPEDAVYIHYTIGNTGLGTILPTNPFKVRLSLMAVGVGIATIDPLHDTLVKAYTDVEYSTFLPEVSGTYPNGGILPVTQFVDLPSTKDILVALGLVSVNDPEDSSAVANALVKLANYRFYFRIDLDVTNTVAESSESNTYAYGGLFSIVSPPDQENFGSYLGQPAFASLLVNSPALDNTTIVDPAFAALVTKYALYQAPAGTPNLLFQDTVQNGSITLNYAPFSGQTFQTVTFDFNLRADDVAIDVQATDDSLLGVWQNVLTLTPPYFGTSGARSLSGYGGLSDNPIVLSVDGNVTDVQKSYTARVTVRDTTAIAARGTNPLMRVVVRNTVAAPGAAPTALTLSTNASAIDLNWTGSLPTTTIDGVSYPGGAFVVERSQAGGSYAVIGNSSTPNFKDSSPGTNVTNTYRVRAITSGGSTAYSATASITIP